MSRAPSTAGGKLDRLSAPAGPPQWMTSSLWDRIVRLPSDVRDRVLERSAIIYYGGAAVSLQEADERALSEEAGIHVQQSLGGV